ncbi:hypothetical protein AVDCRST_MAG84-3981 [uncultured Microcoleus sp.]|uniref:Uncharacterized protein n=1 Tax=uncultured Microcoleus sp. TaxID=259945 RepID=A0A6J4MUF0_9CYAN|nr:hypothetical protein AVDCRST_MAG84-3981 [uncultured Microcoleus sp.]
MFFYFNSPGRMGTQKPGFFTKILRYTPKIREKTRFRGVEVRNFCSK